nr:uncharacterized protein C6orf229 homolog [Cavia porcellus]
MTEKQQPFYMRIGTQMSGYLLRLWTFCHKFWNVTIMGHFVNKKEESILLDMPDISANANICFTGGPGAEKLAAEYMKEVAYLLQNDEVAPNIKILLLQSISCWCYLNPGSQQMVKRLRFIPILVGLLENYLDYSVKQNKSSLLFVKFWICYTLCVLVYNDFSLLKDLKDYNALKYNLQILASENWSGWPENFAEMLHHLTCLYGI